MTSSAQTDGGRLRFDRFESRCEPCPERLCRLFQNEIAPRRRTLLRGERIESPTCLWTVLEGLTASCTTLPDGRRQILGLSTPGEMICPVFGTDSEAVVWTEALAASVLCELDLGGPTNALLAENATYGAELFRMAQAQIRRNEAHLITLGRLDAKERICLFLADMAWRIGRRTPRGWLIRLTMSRGDMADYLGLNPETVSRVLGRVKAAQLLTFLSPTEILVPDLEALESHAPLSPLSAVQAQDISKSVSKPL